MSEKILNIDLISKYAIASKRVKDELYDISESFLKKHPYISNDFNFVLNKRLSTKKLLRPFLCLLASECFLNEKYSNYKHKETVLPLMVTTELFNISTYQTNYVFDKKIPVNETICKNNQIIYSFLTLGIAAKIISDLNIVSAKKIEILDLLNQANSEVYVGQQIDLNLLNFSNLNNLIKVERTEYLEKYFYRCECLGGSTIRYAILSSYQGLNISVDSSEIESLRKIATIYGSLMQFLNDLYDFMDEMQDLKTGKVTFPIYFAIKELDIFDPDIVSQSRVIEVLENFTFSQKRELLIRHSAHKIMKRKFELIEKEFKKMKHLNLKNRFSIMYETLFRGYYYKKVFKI